MDSEIEEVDSQFAIPLMPPMPKPAMCRAQGLPICEPEVIVEPEVEKPYVKPIPPEPVRTLLCECLVQNDEVSIEAMEEAEPHEPPTIDDELQLEDIRMELEKSQKRVQKIDELLSLNTPVCPVEDTCINLQIELGEHVVNSEILQLQRNNHRLEQQIKELQQNCKAADRTLQSVRQSLCRDLEGGQRLQQRLNQINSFKLQMEHEQALCAQRYHHLSRDKYDWDDCYDFISKLSNFSERGHKMLVTRQQYKLEKLLVLDRLNSTKLYIKDLFDFVAHVEPRLSGYHRGSRRRSSHRFNYNRASTKPVTHVAGSLRLDQSIHAFLKRNEDLFAPLEE